MLCFRLPVAAVVVLWVEGEGVARHLPLAVLEAAVVVPLLLVLVPQVVPDM
jgi:hypothetical protein